jgi:hypothetical protein
VGSSADLIKAILQLNNDQRLAKGLSEQIVLLPMGSISSHAKQLTTYYKNMLAKSTSVQIHPIDQKFGSITPPLVWASFSNLQQKEDSRVGKYLQKAKTLLFTLAAHK